MTKVAREMTSLADAPEAYDLYIFADEGFETVEFRTLLGFEAAFPAIVGCETLTIGRAEARPPMEPRRRKLLYSRKVVRRCDL